MMTELEFYRAMYLRYKEYKRGMPRRQLVLDTINCVIGAVLLCIHVAIGTAFVGSKFGYFFGALICTLVSWALLFFSRIYVLECIYMNFKSIWEHCKESRMIITQEEEDLGDYQSYLAKKEMQREAEMSKHAHKDMVVADDGEGVREPIMTSM